LETLEGAGVLSPSVIYGDAGNCLFHIFHFVHLLLVTNIHCAHLTHSDYICCS